MTNGLPSGQSALALVRGDARAIVPVVGYTLLRASLIGVGLFAVGQRKRVLVGAVAGAVAIEVYVLGWAWLNR